MKHITLFLISILFLLKVHAHNKGFSDFDLVKSKLIALSLTTEPYGTELSFKISYQHRYEESLLVFKNPIDSAGAWTDLNYHSVLRNAWDPAFHLYRVLFLTRDYAQTHHNATLEKIHLALNYWIDNNFVSKNWWHNQIGVPFVFSRILLNLGINASTRELEFFRNIIFPRIKRTSSTGQNKIWEQDCFAHAALVNNDTAAFNAALTQIKKNVVLSTQEGIQPDFSFQQHGAMLQFGNYGMHYANSISFWMAIVNNTPYAFGDSSQQLLLDYMNKGLRNCFYKSAMDITAIGRQLRPGSPNARAEGFAIDQKLVGQLHSSVKYKGVKSRIAEPRTISFWRSNYLVHGQDNHFHISVKTHGRFVERIETLNGENKLGAYLNDGVSLLQYSGLEYNSILPLWKWNRLPGITADTIFNVGEPEITKTSNKKSFVGTLSLGVSGISVMDYERNGLRAKKSYFVFDRLMLSLGAGIEKNNMQHVVTGVNQQAKINSEKSWLEGKYKGKKWIYYDRKLYYFIGDNQDLSVTMEKREGAWQDVDAVSDSTRFYKDIFDLYVRHNKKNHYAYAVLLDVDIPEIRHHLKQIANFTWINTADFQALSNDKNDFYVIYRPGSYQLDKQKITVDRPCLLILDKTNKTLAVADPSRSATELNIIIDQKTYHLNFPQQDYKGAAQLIQLK